MGLIGWRFFADEFSADALDARRDLEAARRSADRRADKLRRKQQEARRREKQHIQDEQYEQAQAFQEQFNQSFGSSTPSYKGEEDPSNLYGKFSKDNYKAYQDETARRYGYMYNSYTDGAAPVLSRGMGPNHHQGVKRPQNVQHHSPLGPMARRIRISIGWQPNSGGQNSQSGASAKMDDSSAAGVPGGLTGKLGRPF